MCYILCMTKPSVCVAWGAQGGRAPPKNFGSFLRPFLVVFWHMVFTNGFLIIVKKLGLLTNPYQWIRSFDAKKSYIYIYIVL
jgi:hypothetical protein